MNADATYDQLEYLHQADPLGYLVTSRRSELEAVRERSLSDRKARPLAVLSLAHEGAQSTFTYQPLPQRATAVRDLIDPYITLRTTALDDLPKVKTRQDLLRLFYALRLDYFVKDPSKVSSEDLYDTIKRDDELFNRP